MEGFMEPDMKPEPERPVFWRMGSSDSPRRETSVTRRVVGSQLMPYQLEQQSVPSHESKMPKYGSFSHDLKASKASRSDGGQPLTAAKKATNKTMAVETPISLSVYEMLSLSLFVNEDEEKVQEGKGERQ
ncbi:hypothetical protein QQP08_001751 [Theobroma cacao]|nr:hypothetical protein QQP08_001751 [Theobroma cacao]